jgi:hypothetical protein
MNMRTTMTINDKLYKQVRRSALESGVTVSKYVEDALMVQVLEDTYDMEELERRLKEPTITHAQLVKELKAEGLL